MGGFQLNELEMTVIFVSTGVSTGLMVDKMMKVAPGGLVVPLLPKQTQLQVQNPRLDVDFGVFIALRDIKKKLENTVVDTGPELREQGLETCKFRAGFE